MTHYATCPMCNGDMVNFDACCQYDDCEICNGENVIEVPCCYCKNGKIVLQHLDAIRGCGPEDGGEIPWHKYWPKSPPAATGEIEIPF